MTDTRPIRDEILTHPKAIEIATSAAKRIGRAERLDVVSQKEVYRTIIEAIAAIEEWRERNRLTPTTKGSA